MLGTALRRQYRTTGMVACQFLAARVKSVMTVQPDDVRLPERPSSRLLILDQHKRLLLFKFAHRSGPLAGQTFWAAPGGGLDPGESYEAAACREILEETGLRIDDPGPQIAQRSAVFRVPDGQTVSADERFFLIRVGELKISTQLWSDLERATMADHRWWSRADLASANEPVYPDNLIAILTGAGAW
jgi:8-oxo-dGTP diphosphatase